VKCSQKDCEEVAVARYMWLGCDDYLYACMPHLVAATSIAATMGLVLMPESIRITPPKRMGCGQCRFFKSYDGLNGDCRRHAPQADMTELHHAPVYPNICGGSWCGDFEPDVTLPVGPAEEDPKTPAIEPEPQNSGRRPHEQGDFERVGTWPV